jgi:hypothetical protein
MRTKPKSLSVDRSRSMSGDDLLNDNHNEEEHEHEIEKLAANLGDKENTDFGRLPPPRYVEFIKDYYPQNKTKCIQMLQQVRLQPLHHIQ